MEKFLSAEGALMFQDFVTNADTTLVFYFASGVLQYNPMISFSSFPTSKR